MNSYYGSFRQQYFTEVFPSFSEFKTKMEEVGIPVKIEEESLETLYYLLYAKYGNSVVASSDTNRFIANVAALIFQYGPTWEKRLDIQDKLRELNEEDIFKGPTQIYNHAFNPSTAPTTQTLEELPYINEQTTTKSKKGKLDGYAFLWDLLDTDVTGEFLDKFKKLFLVIVQPEKPLLYVTED